MFIDQFLLNRFVGLSLLVMLELGCRGQGVTGAAPRIAVTPSVLDFGLVALGSTAQRELTVSNTGVAILKVSSIVLTPEGSVFSCEGCKALSLASQGEAKVTIRFTPTDSKPAVGRLTVASEAPNAPEVLVSLAGNLSANCIGESDAAFCERLGRNCGAVTEADNCGAQRTGVSCGICASPLMCGNSNVCGCSSESDTALCAARGANCGSLALIDRCNANRIVHCGSCSDPSQSCGVGGVGNVCGCTPESDEAMCSRVARNCGTLTGTDSCGSQRTIASCGTCPGAQICGASNVCGCVAENDAAFCARNRYACGTLATTDNCGVNRVTTCGSCTNTNETCGAGGTMGVCGCTPESDTVICQSQGKSCGAITATDRCGASRAISSCGTCTAPAHATPQCLANSTCDFTCDDGYGKVGQTCAIACVGSSLTRVPFAAGTGVSTDPYLICVAAQLDRVRDYNGASFRLLANIDLAGLPFEPIVFRAGDFNGNGFIISNWRYNAPTTDDVGFFKNLQGQVRALGLEGAEVTGRDEVGIVAGHCDSATLSDIRVSGTVNGRDRIGGLIGGYNSPLGIVGVTSRAAVNGNNYVGGLFGISATGVSSSWASGAVTGTGDYIGGLVGYLSSRDTLILASYATGAVRGVRSVGGLVGGNLGTATSIDQSYATGSVTGTSAVGGLVGTSLSTITNSFSSGAVTGASNVGGLVGANDGLIGHSYSRSAVSGTTGVGGLVGTNGTSPLAFAADSFWDITASGQGTSLLGIGKTTAQMLDAATFSHWNTDAVWSVGAAYPSFRPTPAPCVRGDSGFAGGKGTASEPYLIEQTRQLYNVQCNVSSAFKLANDLDFMGKAMVPPIGGDGSTIGFAGEFDGNGKTIANMVSYGGSGGLFTSVRGSVHDLTLVNVEVGGSYEVGALAANASGAIARVRSSGVVRGQRKVGGLVGVLGPAAQLLRSSSSVSVVGARDMVGGLVGLVSGTIANCAASGRVTSTSPFDYAAGGLVGFAGEGSLTNSYSVGVVTYGSGLSAGTAMGTATNCYWDTETSGQTSSFHGLGKTTAEMKSQSTYAGWDFTTIWQIVPGSYPSLR